MARSGWFWSLPCTNRGGALLPQNRLPKQKACPLVRISKYGPAATSSVGSGQCRWDASPPSSGCVIDFGPLGPGESVVKPAAEVLGLERNDLARLCIDVKDDVQVTLDEARASERSGKQGTRPLVDLFTRPNDPSLGSTLFWLYGGNRQLQIVVRNPTGYMQQRARVGFPGWRMLTQLMIIQPTGPCVTAITRGWT